MKSVYIDVMEKILSAYSTKDIADYIAEVEEYSIREHGFPRLTANIGILLAHGRRTELRDTFEYMMDICCREIPVVRERYKAVSDDPADRAKFPEVGNNFSVREIVCCLLALEENNTFPKEKTEYWRSLLKTINPETCYSVIARDPNVKIDNWAAFGAASEQARKFAGLGDESKFIDVQIGSQLLSFDENGMYRDPHEPMIYDITTRLQLSVPLYFGYDGPYREQMEDLLDRGALHMLKLQSVTGEVPFGGRSSQFLHNEATLAAVCEYEANRYNQKGDVKLAGQFKAAAKLAIDSVVGYLDTTELYHIKNFYPRNSYYGCENYAHFKKYMITTASFIYLAYLFADESIQPVACPAEKGNHIYRTSPYFHKTVCKFEDYFVEYETEANFEYDANGLGRIHKKGAPSALCLSLPFPNKPNYGLDIENPSALSVCCGIYDEEKLILSAEEGTKYELLNDTVSETEAQLKWNVTLYNGSKVMETCTLSNAGVQLSFERTGEDSVEGKIYAMLPVFEFDGEEKSQIHAEDGKIVVTYKGHSCEYITEGKVQDTGKVYANRNGHYRLFMVEDTQKVEVNVSLK